MSRILFCLPTPVDERLGAARAVLAQAGELRRRGHDCTVVGVDRLGIVGHHTTIPLSAVDDVVDGARFDVVDFELGRYVLDRRLDCADVHVARTQLLSRHLLDVTMSAFPRLRARIRRLLVGPERPSRAELDETRATALAADMTVVLNELSAVRLARDGVDPDRIAVVPNGLSPQRFGELAAASDGADADPVVMFVGMFIPRKGARDLLTLAAAVAERIPDVRFRLIGTAGAVDDAATIVRLFPRAVRDRVEVIPRYDPADLPGLLAGAACGVFPSYFEGFPLGLLEMMAAGLPVVGYDSPGVSELLACELLVEPGDEAAMAAAVVGLLDDPGRRERAGRRALADARRWTLEHSVDELCDVYRKAARLRDTGPAS